MQPNISEEKPVTNIVIPCPAPFNITLDAAAPNVVTADFSPAHLANYQTALGYTGSNKFYLHTFVWKPIRPCCQVTNAVLTITFKANQSGSSSTSSDSGNDTFAIVHAGGTVIPPYSGKVFTTPPAFAAGHTETKTWTLNPAALAVINSSKHLSFLVQDDTMIVSAKLQLSGCCLSA